MEIVPKPTSLYNVLSFAAALRKAVRREEPAAPEADEDTPTTAAELSKPSSAERLKSELGAKSALDTLRAVVHEGHAYALAPIITEHADGREVTEADARSPQYPSGAFFEAFSAFTTASSAGTMSVLGLKQAAAPEAEKTTSPPSSS